jgi:20S proteasome alpha/beta subunit
MSLIVALEGSDGLILASDSRETIGNPRNPININDTSKKLFKLNNHSGIGAVGASELAATLIDKLIKQVQELHSTDDIANIAYNIMKQENISRFVSKHKPWATGVAMILVDYNKLNENDYKPRIYLLSSGVYSVPLLQLCPSGYMLAGISQYTMYLLPILYDRRMKIENLMSLAAYLISVTATQDPGVGGPIRIASITSQEGYKEFLEEDKAIKDIRKKKRFFQKKCILIDLARTYPKKR